MMIYTLSPQVSSSRRLLTKLSASNKNSYRKFATNYIYDLIYFSNALVKDSCDENFLDDEHFTSRLCDRGYRVHIIAPIFENILRSCLSLSSSSSSSSLALNSNSIHNDSIHDIKNDYNGYYNNDYSEYEYEYESHTTIPQQQLNEEVFPCNIPKLLKLLNVNPRSAALLVQELAIPSFLNHFTELSISYSEFEKINSSNNPTIMTQLQQATDVGAIVLLDPPPLVTLYEQVGRRHLLSRYKENIIHQIKRQQALRLHEELNLRSKQTKTMLKKLKMENKLKQKRLEKGNTAENDSSYKIEINQPNLSIDDQANYVMNTLADHILRISSTQQSVAANSDGNMRSSVIKERFRDRILILSTISDLPVETCKLVEMNYYNANNNDENNYDYKMEQSQLCSQDYWGYSAAVEVAEVYDAGPVIRITEDYNNDPDNSSDIVNDTTNTSNDEMQLVQQRCDNGILDSSNKKSSDVFIDKNETNNFDFIENFKAKYLLSSALLINSDTARYFDEEILITNRVDDSTFAVSSSYKNESTMNYKPTPNLNKSKNINTTTIASAYKINQTNSSNDIKIDISHSPSSDWHARERKRHHDIETVISDWFDMLTVCQYI